MPGTILTHWHVMQSLLTIHWENMIIPINGEHWGLHKLSHTWNHTDSWWQDRNQSPGYLTVSRPGLLSTGHRTLYQGSPGHWSPFCYGHYQGWTLPPSTQASPLSDLNFYHLIPRSPSNVEELEIKSVGKIEKQYIRDVLGTDVPETVTSIHLCFFALSVPSAWILNLCLVKFISL